MGDIVWPPPILWPYTTVTKGDLLRRLRHILNDLKGVTSRSKFLGEETADLDYDISQVEKELAKLIDDYMAGQIARHNRETKIRRR